MEVDKSEYIFYVAAAIRLESWGGQRTMSSSFRSSDHQAHWEWRLGSCRHPIMTIPLVGTGEDKFQPITYAGRKDLQFHWTLAKLCKIDGLAHFSRHNWPAIQIHPTIGRVLGWLHGGYILKQRRWSSINLRWWEVLWKSALSHWWQQGDHRYHNPSTNPDCFFWLLAGSDSNRHHEIS